MAEAKSETGEKKSSKKMIVIIAIVIALLGAGGAAGYFFFLHKPADAEHQAESDKKHEEEKKHAEEPEEKHEETELPEVYFNLPDPFLVNFPPGASAKIIKIAITVKVKGEPNIEIIKKHLPMIKNNLLMTISSIGVDKAKTLEGKRELQSLMLSEIGKVMEKMNKTNPVKDVYFTDFVMQ